MADTDLIACIYPCYDKHIQNALKAIKLSGNELRYVPGLDELESQADRHSRAPTEEPESRGDDEPDNRTRLELRFSHGPRTSHGFMFGRSENCDIVLPHFRGVSSYHFALTFDDHNRPIVKDIGSFIGTEVTYNNDGQGRRRDFVWIVGGHEVPRDRTPIVVNVNEHLKFQLVLSHHDTNSQSYKDNIERLRRGTTDGECLFSRLKLPVETERATGTHTPGRGPIYLRKRLGKGSFGVVTHFWNVSTAEEYALKQPSDTAIKENDFDVYEWMREADIMGRISHEHIVQLLWKEEVPWPKLYLEYVPGGSLRDQVDLSIGECKQVLRQLLSALAYLHGLEQPILHRDIKPENILVQHRYADDIYVKFGDFGISRERRQSGQWKTICGTWKYIAPEMFEIKRYRKCGGRTKKRYTAAVDIWSLGVVMLRLVSGIPRYKAEYEDEGTHWGEKILTKLREDLRTRSNDVLRFLSTAMLIIEPTSRCSAQMCYDGALRLPGEANAALQTLPWVEDQQATLRIPQTAIFQGTRVPPRPSCAEDDSIETAEIERYIIRSDSLKGSIGSADSVRQVARSDNPPPSSRRRWPSRISKSSTATRSRHTRRASVSAASRGNEDEVDPEIGFCYQDPAKSLCIGSSVSALERELPSSWDQALENSLAPSPEPNLVAGGVGYAAQDRSELGRSWGAGGRSWGVEERSWDVERHSRGGGRPHEGTDTVVQGAYDDGDVAAALLLAIQSDSYARAV